jgi:pimeloyl-ACP methyl ester carboxylesterase
MPRASGVRQLTTGLVPDSGHFIPDEQPEGLWQHIHGFIADSIH